MELDLHGQCLGIERLVAEVAGTEVAQVEVQALHQVEDDCRRVDGCYLVVDVRRDVVDSQLLHHQDVVGLLATSGLHQDGGGTRIGLRRAQQVERGQTHADDERQDEPGPVAQAYQQHVGDAERVVSLWTAGSASGIGLCLCHFCNFNYLTIL